MVSFGKASGRRSHSRRNLLAQKGSLFLTRPTLFNYIATREELERQRRRAVRDRRERQGEDRSEAALRRCATPRKRIARWKRGKTTGSTVLTI